MDVQCLKPLLLFFLTLPGLHAIAWAQHRFPEAYQPKRLYTGQSIYDLRRLAEANVDIGLWALIIAHTFDASVDVAHYLRRLDHMASAIQRMLAGRTRDIDKFLAVRTVLYEPGPWNEGRPFSYDLDDPLGARPGNQLLTTYLDTRKGNCVSMPTLFLALMERIDPDLPLRGVLVPMHLFVRLYDRQSGDIWNVETTNEGHPARNQWYIEQMDIPPSAIAQGTYLSDLTKREYLAELLNVLTRKERLAERYQAALAYAELALHLNPNAINALIQKGALLAWLVYDATEQAKQTGGSLSAAERDHLQTLTTASTQAIAEAQRLGWRPETPEHRTRYLQRVAAEKARRHATNDR